MFSIRIKFWLKASFFLRPNTSVRNRSILKLLHYKVFGSFQTYIGIKDQDFISLSISFFKYYSNGDNWNSNLFNKIEFANKQISYIEIFIYLILKLLGQVQNYFILIFYYYPLVLAIFCMCLVLCRLLYPILYQSIFILQLHHLYICFNFYT